MRIYDLSVPLHNQALYDPKPPEIRYIDHREAARMVAREWRLSPGDFPDGLHLAREEVRLSTHNGTHVDAPYHYGPSVEEKPARTIEEVPLEWCFADGVVLDLSGMAEGHAITTNDLKGALDQLGHNLVKNQAVLLRTGIEKWLDHPEFIHRHPGLTVEATSWLVEKGVRLIGTDAWGLDIPIKMMIQSFKAGDKNALWPSHYFGRENEYIHVEKLCNLGKLPSPTGFKFAAFPIAVAGASAGWCRAVAIYP